MKASSQIALLAAISKVQATFILDSDSVTAFQQLLNSLLELTASEYGFIGEIQRSEQKPPFLKTHAVTNIAWDQETTELYEKYAPSLEFHNFDNLFGHVITSGQPVISNRPDLDPRRGGLPKGHPPLHAFLGIPLYFGDQLIGMVGVANRPGGYDEDLISFLVPFLNTCSVLLKGSFASEQKEQIDQQRQNQTARLQAILDNVADGVITIDSGGRIETFNRAAERLFGYSTSEVLSREANLLMSEEYRTGPDAILNTASLVEAQSLDGMNRNVAAKRKDGTLFPADISLARFDVNDQVLFAAIIRDQTEQQRVQASLLESDRHLREAQVLAHLGSWTWFIDSKRHVWSDELYRLLGHQPQSVAPGLQTLQSALHPEDRSRVTTNIETTLSLHDCFEEEFRVQLPHGQVRHILGRYLIDRGPTGSPLLMRAIFLDVTAERVATHSRNILSYAVEHGMEGIALLDRDGRYIYMNPAHAAMYGFTVNELIGRTWRELYHPEGIEYIQRDIFPQLIQSGSWSGELTGRKKSADSFDVEISLCLLSGPMASGQEFLVCTCRDITSRKRDEATIRQHTEELESRVKDRTAELATASSQLRKLSQELMRTQERERRRLATDLHDEIGQALTALNINLQVLREEHPGHISLDDCLNLTGHILNQVRELAAGLRPQLLDEFGFGEALRMYAERQAERNGWQLDLKIEGDWHECTDETVVTCFRILQESLTNAAKHANAALVNVRVTFQKSVAEVRVEDNGIGFELHNPICRETMPGNGLTGMCERVELAGGTFFVQSSPGHGTRIHVLIPIIRRSDHP